MEHDELQGLTDEITIAQLAGIVYEIDSRGRLRIEPKEKARARGVASPDRAEALMLALAKPAESPLPLFIRQNLAVIQHKAGKSLETIAEGFVRDR